MAKKTAKKGAAKAAAPAKQKKTAATKSAKPTKQKGATLGDPMKSFQVIKDSVVVLEEELRKFVDEEVKASGRRSRGHAQDIRKAAQQLRKEVQALANSRKGK